MSYYVSKRVNGRSSLVSKNLSLQEAIAVWQSLNPFYIFDEDGNVVMPFKVDYQQE